MSDHASPHADDLGILLAERAINRLMVDHARFIDHGEAHRVADLFTADGIWEGPGVHLRGRAEILEYFRARATLVRRTSRHVVTNVLVDVMDDGVAEALSYVVNYRRDEPDDRAPTPPVPIDHPKLMGEYRDRFLRTSRGWRFARRTFVNTFLR